MTTDPLVRAALTLRRLRGIGKGRARQLLDDMSSWTSEPDETVLRAEIGRRTGFLPTARAIGRAWHEADATVARCHRENLRIVSYGSPAYPSPLLRLADPPTLLFSLGTMQSLPTRRIAVVGTRAASPAGRHMARAIVRDLAGVRATIVSGLALGIDTVAHREAIERGLATWAVLPNGIGVVYPATNKALAARIAAGHGALISEYEPGTQPSRYSFVERDRIQAGLSDAVVIVETEIDGGAMHTARFAFQARIPVYVADLEKTEGSRPVASRRGKARAITDLLRRGARTVNSLLKDLALLPRGRGFVV